MNDLTGLLKKQLSLPEPPGPTKIHLIQGEITMAELYAQLLSNEDIFVEVGGESVHRIRKGLSSIKAKDNAKLKAADLPVDRFKIEYTIVKEDKENKVVRMRIRIVQPDMVAVRKIEVADKEMI